jgi:hypothetical protein
MESGRPALLYTALNNLNIDLTTGSRIVLKSYSNLYLLEHPIESNNVYPTGIGFIQGSGLPNGLSLHNYNTITGIVNTTGYWSVATRYLYPNVANPVTKVFHIFVKRTGDINLYASPNFETIFTGNGQPVFPTNNGNDIQIPVEENGNIVFVPSGELTGAAPFIDSEGETLEGGAEEPIEGGGKGDPINIMPLRIFSNAQTSISGLITGFSGIAKVSISRYIDTRTRTENLFLGRIGNRYTRIDTQTTSGWTNSTAGVIQGVKLSQGILGISGDQYLPYGFETNATTYFIATGFVNTVPAMSLIRYDKNGQAIDITEGGRVVDPNNPVPGRTNPLRFFSIRKNIGIDDITAFTFIWNNNLTEVRGFNQAMIGGSYGFILGDLHTFDQVGGSLIEHLNYVYNKSPFYSTGTLDCPVGGGAFLSAWPDLKIDTTGVQTSENWQEWGKTLKWVELNNKAKHFYGINWIMSKLPLTPVGQIAYPPLTGIITKWKRNDPDWLNSGILITGDAWLRTCKLPPNGGGVTNNPVFGCPDCDPACENFNGDFNAANSSPVGCGGGTPMSQHLANCYDVPWSSTPCPSSSSSGPGSNNFIDYVEFENLIN